MYEMIIIGGGPAGLTAGIYGKRGNLKVLLLEKMAVGGQLLLTDAVENYPGFVEIISGFELVEKLRKQAEKFGVEIVTDEVKNISREEESQLWQVRTEKDLYETFTVVIATGAKQRKLEAPGEDRLVGKGVSYCAMCDGPFFKGKKIIVVGGSNTAVKEALFLTNFAKEVVLIHRRGRLRAEQILQERLFSNERIEVIWKSMITGVLGENKVEAVTVENVNTHQKRQISCDGVFIFIGLDPNTEFLKGLVEVDTNGYIITDDDMNTSQEGIFACGDCRKKLLRQVVTACSDGAVASAAAFRYIEKVKGIKYE
ncbi:MAG TPA: thioredoxin-disulfide reductase [Candidatus Omnitrophica bacterium]|nr:thioredoxin-disulfide reductase [Candidatus Omnitrophota bacterium]